MILQLKKLKYFLLPYSILLFLGLLALTFFSKSALFFFVNNKHNAFFDIFFATATNVGDGWCFAVFLIVSFFFVTRKKFYFGVALFISTALVSVLFNRVFFSAELRPLAWFKNPSTIHFVDGVTVYSQNSFPSGHTITAFCFAFYATYLIKNKKFGFVFLISAILVGYSRIYLGQHFFGDVVFGSVISIVTSLICLYIFDKYVFLENNKAPF